MFRAWLREPVTLFVVLGLALFVADRVWNGAPVPVGEASHIVVTATQQATLRDAFRAENGRNPTAEELRSRLDRWVEEQVLYREALALNLDRKDLIVHRQLTQKMRFLLEDSSALPTPSDAQLQGWLDQQMARYGKPSSISFQQVFLSRGRRADHLHADAAKISVALAATPDQFLGLGDSFPLGQEIKDANPTQLRREFGAEFAAALQTLHRSGWSGPLASGFGLHLVRITGTHDFQPIGLPEVRQQVLTDYQLDQRERTTQAAIDNLKKKYRVEFEALAE
jgi:peptidyl-prolyl cis-trans isomerase C